MGKVHILVEGQTEETFVRRILAAHLSKSNVHPNPILVKTAQTAGGGASKGGYLPYGRVRKDILRLLADTSAAMVTTMLDFYGLSRSFPGRNDLPEGDCFERVAHVEREFGSDIGDRKFLPYLMLHEFEAMLFVSPEQMVDVFPGTTGVAELLAVKRSFNSPEEINDDPKSCPSARILSYLPRYRKALHDPLIAERIGIDRIRNECRHFDSWIRRLETLG